MSPPTRKNSFRKEPPAMIPADLDLPYPLAPPPPCSHRYVTQRMQHRAETANEHGDQDLKQLINDALEVQDSLNTVKNQLANLDSAENTVPLDSLALECQEKTCDLLTSSRDSASILIAHLEDFTQNIVPLVQDTRVSRPDKIIEVKSAAELIAITAEESPTKTQKEFKDLKTGLTRLSKMVHEYLHEITSCAQVPMDHLLTEIYGLEVQITTSLARQINVVGREIDMFQAVPVVMRVHLHDQNTVTTTRPTRQLVEKVKVKNSKLIAFVKAAGEACAGLKQFFNDETFYAADSRAIEWKRFEVAKLRSEVEIKQLEIVRVQHGLNMVISQFAALNNKLGQFEGMWNKLIEDVKALHKYLENPSPWLTAQEFERRVAREGVLYKKIRGALEMYAIKGRHT